MNVSRPIICCFYLRVHLSKRRARGGAGGVQSAVSQLVVKHRELNDNERKAQVSQSRVVC